MTKARKLLLIASGNNIAKYAYQLQTELGFPADFEIANVHMEQALEYVRNLLRNGTPGIDVLIARGNTAKLLRDAKLPIPIVTIPVADFEIINAIKLADERAGKAKPLIGYIGLEDIISRVRHFLETLHYEVRLYPAKSTADIEKSIVQAQRDQMDVLIGGVYTCQLLENIGVKHVLLESSLDSVREAYLNARDVQRSRNLQRIRRREQDTILNSAANGIISMNEQGIVTSMNRIAADYFGAASVPVLGKHFSDVLGKQNSLPVMAALQSGETQPDFVIQLNGQPLRITANPVIMNGSIKGAVLSVQEHSPRRTAARTGNWGPDEVRPTFQEALGRSEAAVQMLHTAQRYAAWNAPVLMIGEPGTGKRFWAECIHSAGPRASFPFLSLSCAAFSGSSANAFASPATSFESGLLSLIKKADGGTVYLGGIEGLPFREQVLLADFLATKAIGFGETGDPIVADVRVIASCQCNLPEQVRTGQFYRSLYNAINSLPLPLPRLNQRSEDIAVFAQHGVEQAALKYSKNAYLSQESLVFLQDCQWDGNIAQLQSVCQRLVALSVQEELTIEWVKKQLNEEALYEHLQPTTPYRFIGPTDEGIIIGGQRTSYAELREMDRFYGGNRTLMAQKLGVSRTTLWKHLKQLSQWESENAERQ